MTDAGTSDRDKTDDTNESEMCSTSAKVCFFGGEWVFDVRQQNYSGDVANFYVALSLTTMILHEQLVLAVWHFVRRYTMNIYVIFVLVSAYKSKTTNKTAVRSL
jgi:hypothetical protein